MLVSILIYFLNSLINFPVHRPQEIIPFILLSAFILLLKKDIKYLKKTKLVINFLVVVALFFTSILSFKQHQSLVNENILKKQYYGAGDKYNGNDFIAVNYKFPNLSSNTVPIATYMAKKLIVKNQTSKQIIMGLDDPYPLGEMESESQSSYPGKILDLAQDQKILTSEECDAIWDDNVLQWLFGDDKKKKQDLINKIIS